VDPPTRLAARRCGWWSFRSRVFLRSLAEEKRLCFHGGRAISDARSYLIVCRDDHLARRRERNYYRGLVTVLMGLEARLRLARLYLCTDAREKQGDLESFLRAAFAGGVDIVQIRDKGMKPEAELAALEIARQAAAPHQAIVCVNDSAKLAERFQSDMLHLGQSDGSSTKARKYLHRWALLGRSTHATRQADKAIKDRNVDYFCVGPVYATSTKPDYPPVGLDLVRYAARNAPVADIESKPWFAIGGITMDNIDDVIEAGARRVCVVRAITQASDPQEAAQRLSSRLRAAWKADPAMERYVIQALSAPGTSR
jgi:thiamine-phosphate pyrophosphorylase